MQIIWRGQLRTVQSYKMHRNKHCYVHKIFCFTTGSHIAGIVIFCLYSSGYFLRQSRFSPSSFVFLIATELFGPSPTEVNAKI